MAVSPEDKYARRVFMHLNSIQAAISDKAAMLTEAGGSEAYQRAVSGSAMMFMHHVADPDTDLDTVDIHGWPWPKPEDFPEEAPVLTLSEALEESIEDNPDLFDEAPADPDSELAAENERLRARVAELEASPPPSPAVVALEGMEALKAKLDAGRVQVPADLADALAGDDVATPEARLKLTERLNIEKAELRRERAAGDMPAERETQVDRLLNWLAQFGEA